MVRKRRKSSEEEDSYGKNRRKEETRRRRRESSSEEEDRYRRRDYESRRRRRRGESSERGNGKTDRFGRDISRRDGSTEEASRPPPLSSVLVSNSSPPLGIEEKRARHEEDRKEKRTRTGGNKDGEKNTPIQPVANASSTSNQKSLNGGSGTKKEREGSSHLPREGSRATREKGSNHIGDNAKNKDIGGTKGTQKRHEGREKAVLGKGVTCTSADTNKTKEDQQPTSWEMPPPVQSKDLHGARTQEEAVPSANAGRTGSTARKKPNEETVGEAGEKAVLPEEPSATLTTDRRRTATSAEQRVRRNTDPVKNTLDSSNCSRAEKEKEEEVKEQGHSMADSKSQDPGSARSVIPGDDRQTGSDLLSVSEAEPPTASGGESQSETPETPRRQE